MHMMTSLCCLPRREHPLKTVHLQSAVLLWLSHASPRHDILHSLHLHAVCFVLNLCLDHPPRTNKYFQKKIMHQTSRKKLEPYYPNAPRNRPKETVPLALPRPLYMILQTL